MMRALLPLLLLLTCLPTALRAESPARPLVVIVNAGNTVSAMTPREVSDIYLGRSKTFAGGQYATPVDHAAASPLRARFFYDLTGKPVAEINAYWARLLFSGQSQPPRAEADSEAVLAAVRGNPQAIGYLDRDPADRKVRVVLALPPRP